MISIAQPLIGREEIEAVRKVLESGIIACGPLTEEFEKRFADFVGTKHAIATNSGTTALHLALLCLRIGNGDEVIVPSFSFIASANAPLFCNAKPVFCDIDPETFNLDVEKIKELITSKTKAIIPVHLYGQPADMRPILEIANSKNISVICDACQAHGAEYNQRMVGSFGDMECFSFYPTKNMTTGEGGMVTTNDREIYQKALSIRNHGREHTKLGYEHNRIGYNYRTTDIASAIGIEQLKKLPTFLNKRRKNAKFFNENFRDIDTPFVLKNSKHSFHQYTIKSKNRDVIIKNLKKHKIGFGIYYPKPLHFYKHLKQFGHNDLKNSEAVANEVISLPIHPAVSNEDLEKIVEALS